MVQCSRRGPPLLRPSPPAHQTPAAVLHRRVHKGPDAPGDALLLRGVQEPRRVGGSRGVGRDAAFLLDGAHVEEVPGVYEGVE